MNEKGEQFYEFVKAQGINVPNSYGEFKTAMQDANTASQFHAFVSSKNISVPESVEEFKSVFSEEGKPVNFTPVSSEPSEEATREQSQGGTPSPSQPLQPSEESVAKPSVLNNQSEQPSEGERTPEYLVNGKPFSKKQIEKQLSNPKFIEKVKSGEIDVTINNDQELAMLLNPNLATTSDGKYSVDISGTILFPKTGGQPEQTTFQELVEISRGDTDAAIKMFANRSEMDIVAKSPSKERVKEMLEEPVSTQEEISQEFAVRYSAGSLYNDYTDKNVRLDSIYSEVNRLEALDTPPQEEIKNLKTEARNVAEQVKEAADNIVRPVVSKNIGKYFNEDNTPKDEWVTENFYGFPQVDVDKIRETLPKNPDEFIVDENLRTKYISDISNIIQGRIDAPEALREERRDQIFKEKNGQSFDEQIDADAKKAFNERYADPLKNIADSYSTKVDSVASEIAVDYRNYSDSLKTEFDKISNDYNSQIATIQEEANNVTSGEDLKVLQSEADKLTSDYNKKVDAYIRQDAEYIAEENSRANELNKQFYTESKQQTDALSKEFSETYKVPQNLIEDYQEAYNKATQELIVKNNKDKKAVIQYDTDIPLGRAATSTLSSLGGSLYAITKAYGGEFPELKRMEQYFQPGVDPIKGFSDLNLYNIQESAGQLLGSMAPSITASIVTAIATKNLSTASRMFAVGGVGFVVETSDLSGRAYQTALEETGSTAIAKNAATETIDSQLLLFPTYLLTAIPFIGGLSKIANRPLRMLAGGTVEFLSEGLLQELPQQISEESIQKYGEFERALEFLTPEKAEEVLANVAPVFVVGAAGSFNADAANKLGNVIDRYPELARQHLIDFTYKNGKEGSALYLATLHSNGAINIETAENLYEFVESIDLDNTQEYTALKAKKDDLAFLQEGEKDEVKKKVIGKQIAEIDTQLENILEGKETNVTQTTVGGSDYFVTASEVENTDKQQDLEDVQKSIDEAEGKPVEEAPLVTDETTAEEDIDNALTDEIIPITDLEVTGLFTHQTRRPDAIISWITGGKVVGKNEDLNEFTEDFETTPFATGRHNTKAPNFQEGGLYGGVLSKGMKFVITRSGQENFTPNLAFSNKKSFDASRGVGVPKPNSRNISDFTFYKVTQDGKLQKIDISKLRNKVKSNKANGKAVESITKTTKKETTTEEAPLVTDESGEVVTVYRGGKSASGVQYYTSDRKLAEGIGEAKGEGVQKATVRMANPWTPESLDVNNAPQWMQDWVRSQEEFTTVDEETMAAEEIPMEQAIQEIKDMQLSFRDVGLWQSFVNETLKHHDGIIAFDPSEDMATDKKIYITRSPEQVIRKEDAVQEQAAGKVPVQPEAKAGEKVEEGKPKTEPKVTTEEGKEEVSEEEVTPSKERLDEQIDGIIKKVKDRTSDKADPKKVNKRAFDDAIEYLQSSLWYEKANDLQREASVIELMEKTKQPIKKSMTMKGAIKKAFPPTPEKRVSMTPLAALKKQIQDFARGMREAAKDQRATAKNANDLLKELQKSGLITPRQAGALTRAALKVNFASPKSIENFTNRVEKTISDIEYNTKLSDARKLRGKIKPKKNTLASDKARMNEFRKIDPKNVEDIDAYIEKANEIIAATKSPRRTAKGVSLPTAMDYAAIDEYNKTTLEEQDKKAKQSIKDQYDYLEDFDLTVEEMNEIISLLEQGKEPQLTDARKEQINERLNTLFTFYKPALKEKLTEEALTDTEKKILKSLSDGNINNLPFNEKARTIKIAENILQNNDFSAAQQVVNAIDAQQSVAEMQKMNIKFDTRKTYFQKLASLTQAMKFIFRGVNAANNFAVKAGITDFDIGVVKGTNRIKDLIDRYDAMVKNMDDHNTAENIVKRRVYSFLNRNDGTTATEKKAEFDRRKGLINEQLEYLKLTDGEFAKELETVLSDLGIAEAQTADDIQIDEQNKKIVDFFVQEFEDLYDEHAEVAKVLYNKILPQDYKYVPDVFEKVDKSDMFVGLDESVYFEDAIDTKETSMLQDVSKPSSLPKVNGEVTRAINLDFDRIMMRKLEDAIKEIETAQSVDKLKRVLTTQNLNKFLSPSQADLLKSKITNYVNAIRGKSREQQEIADSKTVNKVIDVISNFTASKILGSAAQPIKQTIPVYMRSTMNMSSKGSAAMNNALIGEAPELVEIANKYGEVSLRGKQSVVDVDALTSKVNFDKLSDSVIKLVGISGAKNIRDAKNSLSKAGEAPLKYALEKPDKWMATASWAGYYTDYLYKNKPDFNLKEELENPTKEAIQYANSRVSETQNESQREKMGDVFTSKSTVAKLIRNVLLPFASFQQNLRTDIYTNIGITKSKTASKEDIDIARKSIASALMEMAIFNVLSVSLRALTVLSIKALLGYDDEEEERELEPILGIPLTKKDRNILYTNIVSDVAPLPVVDDALLYTIEAINKYDIGEKYDKYKDNIVYAPGSAEEIILNKGGKFGAAYGIITDTKTKLDMSDLVNEDGTFTKSTIYGDIEYPMPEYLENDINLMIGLQALYLLGAPRELKTASDKIRKEVEKQGKAQRKLEKQLMR